MGNSCNWAQTIRIRSSSYGVSGKQSFSKTVYNATAIKSEMLPVVWSYISAKIQHRNLTSASFKFES